MNWLLNNFDFNSVVDFGCGLGTYLEAASNYGVETVKGYEFSSGDVEKYTNPVIKPFIEYGIDCSEPIDKLAKYDLAMSIEVGEHIPESGANGFVKNICNSVKDDGFIIFSAAQPNQGGSGHINCQPKEYWFEKFNSNGFKLNEDYYKKIKKGWQECGAPNYIINNFFVVKKSL